VRIERLYGVELGAAAAGDASGGPDWLLDRLLETGTLPAGTSRDYFRQYVEGYKSNVRAASSYQPSAWPIDVPLLVVRAAERDAAIDQGLAAGADLGWGPFSTRGVRVMTTSGTHISMLTEPCVHRLADGLVAALGPGAATNEG
jgi:thioesterase domain-containing protein